MAQIGDSHTKVQPPNLPFRVYPLFVRWLKEGLFVTGAVDSYGRALATRVIRIGDSDIDAIQTAVATLIPAENESYLKDQSVMVMMIPEALQYLGLVSEQNLDEFTFQGKDGQQFQARIQPIQRMQMTGFRWVSTPDEKDPRLPVSRGQRKAPLYWHEWLDDAKTLYFQYNACREFPKRPLGPLIDELLAFVESCPVEKFMR